MDRYIVREPRAVTDYPREDQTIVTYFGSDNGGMTLEKMFLGKFGGMGAMNMPRPGFMGPQMTHVSSPQMTHVSSPQMTHVSSPQMKHVSSPYTPPTPNANQHQPGHGQMMSGIDPRYLAMYNDSNAAFIAGQRHQMERQRAPNPGLTVSNQHPINNYPQTEYTETFASHVPPMAPVPRSPVNPMKRKMAPNENDSKENASLDCNNLSVARDAGGNVSLPTRQPTPTIQPEPLTRLDKLKALQKGGPRAFSGPVEKVLKWHKTLHDVGVFVYYEIVAKCLNVRPGEGCSKNLVVRDDNGPAMQVVYYEIDFMLPEFKVPCTIRVIGRMQPGTCRLQAFNVRLATSDDVATLPRRAAVAAHHVAKLSKEYGPNAA